MFMYRTITKDRKNYVTLTELSDGNYVVKCKINGIRKEYDYISYNHACFKFDAFHNFIKRNFENVLTNLK